MALKSRWWWGCVDHEDWESYNFCWTQWKSNKVINSLKKHQDTLYTGDASNKPLNTSNSSASTSAVSSSNQDS